jgi:lipopolysaccharide export system permease protein
MNGVQRYLLRQLAGPLVFFTLALTGVIWLTQSLRFVDLIVNRGLSASTFLYISFLILPGALALILPIALFAALLYTYQRLQADSELVVMSATGLGPWQLARPALVVAGAVTLLGYLNTLYLMPTGARAFADTKLRLRTDLAHVLLQDGTFNLIGERLTVYLRARQPNGELLGILVHDTRDANKPITMMAERAVAVRTPEGPRFVMVNGNRQEVDRQKGQLSLLHFDRYALDLSVYLAEPEASWREPNQRYLPELFNPGSAPDDIATAGRMRAEGHQRLTAPLYALSFVLLGLAATVGGEYSRRGSGRRILGAVMAGVVLRAAGLLAVNLSAKHPAVIPLVYLIPLGSAGAAAWWLTVRRRLSQAAATPA